MIAIGSNRTVDETREAIGTLDAFVEHEFQSRCMTQRESAPDLAAQKSCGAIEPRLHFGDGVSLTEGHERNSRDALIGRQVDGGDRHVPHARIFDLARYEFGDDPLKFGADA